MPVHDLNAQRLYLDAALHAGVEIAASSDQANYLRNVLRLGAGATILVFNGRDGEWRATLGWSGKRGVTLVLSEPTRPQTAGPDIDYLFAPLKRARLDYMVQKAAEMGVRRLAPVLTRHTVAERVNVERMRANAIEAAEQCGILSVPEICSPVKLAAALAVWDSRRRLIVCDEGAEVADPLTALRGVSPGPLGVLVGPEGGFAPEEREMLCAQAYVTRISLGPRILRADTAAVAALALINATLGDWR